MNTYFFDSSALVKLYVEEPGSPQAERIVQQGFAVVSRLATVEVTSAIARKARQVNHYEPELVSLLDGMDEDLTRRFEIVDLGGATILRATGLVRQHGLRAADAIQLACALIARGDTSRSGDFTFVSSDQELNTAATAEDLRVLDPTAE